MINLIFRQATSPDASEISHLINFAYRGKPLRQGWTTEEDLVSGERISSEEVRKLIATPDNFILLAYSIQNTLIGCVHVNVEGNDFIYFGMLAVEPSSQATGAGKALIAEIEKQARRVGSKVIRLTVVNVRKELIEFYQRRGFQLTGAFEDYPFPERLKLPGITLLEMQKTIAID